MNDDLAETIGLGRALEHLMILSIFNSIHTHAYTHTHHGHNDATQNYTHVHQTHVSTFTQMHTYNFSHLSLKNILSTFANKAPM